MNYSKHSNKKNKKDYESPNKKVKSKVGVIIFRIIFIALLIAVFAATGAVLGAVMGTVKNAPPLDQITLSPEGYATKIFDQNGVEITELHGKDANRVRVDLEQVPKHLQLAFVATEDERYYSHFGVDVKGLFRALYKNIQTRSFSEGASTITQQLIKNNVLSAEKAMTRKIQEQYLAIQVEKELTDKYGKQRAKDIILEEYLNTIALGRGTLGVQQASKRYFNKDVSDLTLAESTVLAGITQRPTYYDPISNPKNNQEKQHIILGKMLELAYITEAEYKTAIEEDVYSEIQEVSQEIASKTSNNSYFVDEVIERVVQDLMTQLGISETEAYNRLYRGGLKIYITQDMKMQSVLDAAFKNDDLFPPKNSDFEYKVDYALAIKHANGETKNYYLPQNEIYYKTKEAAEAAIEKIKSDHFQNGDKIIAERKIFIPEPQASMIITDYHNGEVKALVGGRGEKIGDRTLNRATATKRQPGSTFKVLAAYAPAIDTAGYTAGTIIDDVPFSIQPGPGQDPYEPKNWYKNYKGLTTVRESIKRSMNINAVKTLADIGVQTGYDYVRNFGINLPSSDKVYALALGGISGLTLMDLNAAYGAIANDGVYVEPILYTKVLDHEGNILLEKTPEKHTVLKDTTAFILTDMMKDVVTGQYGTGGRAKFRNVNMPVAGKTGTTQNDSDLLFAGYTPYYAASIWTGHDEIKPINYKAIGSYHLDIWRTVMEEIHKDLPYKDFDQPDGLVQRTICTKSGKLAVPGLCDEAPLIENKPNVVTEWFVKGTEPTLDCDVHVREKVCTESGLFANKYCPEDVVEERIFIKRPENMKLPYEDLDEETLNKILDYQYELPPSMEGEYCNIHGPSSDLPAGLDDFFDNIFGPEHNNEPNSGDNTSKDDNKKEDKDRNALDDFFRFP